MKRSLPKSKDVVYDNRSQFSKLLGELEPSKKLLKKLLETKQSEEKGRSSSNDERKKEFEECSIGTPEHEDIPASENELSLSENENETDNDNYNDYDDDDDDENEVVDTLDPFLHHFQRDLPEIVIEKIRENPKMEKTKMDESQHLSKECFNYDFELLSDYIFPNLEKSKNMLSSTLKKKLLDNWRTVNKSKAKSNLSSLQQSLYQNIFPYQDLLFLNRNFENAEEIRRLYSLHVVNHVLKSRNLILKNNAKLAKASEKGVEIDDLRDQGITRPKVLIVAPFKDSCWKIVNLMIKICFGNDKKAEITQKKRFKAEFGSDDVPKQKSFRPDDFKSMFSGNIDDCFRIGISFAKKSMKLFAPFYSADIIIASPLGLRTIIASESEKQDYDFLSSIEILILDQPDVFLMQNWEHVVTILDHLHKTPKSSHDADFSRLRMWNANEWSQHYRQTLLFSSIQFPELNNIFNKYCCNFAGKVKMAPVEIQGTVQQIVSEIPQVFHRVDVQSYTMLADKKFHYFTEKILPDLKSRSQDSIAIYVPSYFDFVRVRNYFKKEEISFVQISEYSKKSYISQARTLFKEKRKQFLIFTGRFFFYYRHRITGIKHLLFYDLPQYPQFYSEIVNFMNVKNEDSTQGFSCISMYSRYDANKLERVVGTIRFKNLLTSKPIHMIVTGV